MKLAGRQVAPPARGTLVEVRGADRRPVRPDRAPPRPRPGSPSSARRRCPRRRRSTPGQAGEPTEGRLATVRGTITAAPTKATSGDIAFTIEGSDGATLRIARRRLRRPRRRRSCAREPWRHAHRDRRPACVAQGRARRLPAVGPRPGRRRASRPPPTAVARDADAVARRRAAGVAPVVSIAAAKAARRHDRVTVEGVGHGRPHAARRLGPPDDRRGRHGRHRALPRRGRTAGDRGRRPRPGDRHRRHGVGRAAAPGRGHPGPRIARGARPRPPRRADRGRRSGGSCACDGHDRRASTGSATAGPPSSSSGSTRGSRSRAWPGSGIPSHRRSSRAGSATVTGIVKRAVPDGDGPAVRGRAALARRHRARRRVATPAAASARTGRGRRARGARARDGDPGLAGRRTGDRGGRRPRATSRRHLGERGPGRRARDRRRGGRRPARRRHGDGTDRARGRRRRTLARAAPARRRAQRHRHPGAARRARARGRRTRATSCSSATSAATSRLGRSAAGDGAASALGPRARAAALGGRRRSLRGRGTLAGDRGAVDRRALARRLGRGASSAAIVARRAHRPGSAARRPSPRSPGGGRWRPYPGAARRELLRPSRAEPPDADRPVRDRPDPGPNAARAWATLGPSVAHARAERARIGLTLAESAPYPRSQPHAQSSVGERGSEHLPNADARVAVPTGERQYHIGLGPGELADYILLPGDQDRVERVASRFDSVERTHRHREFASATGAVPRPARLVRVDRASAPTTSRSCIAEILALVERPTFIRIGSCGALQPGMELGDLVISTGSVRLETTTNWFVHEGYPAVAHYEAVLALDRGRRGARTPPPPGDHGHRAGVLRRAGAPDPAAPHPLP